jgi:hypothetical protein
LRDWTQAALAAILTPAWLIGEWEVATRPFWGTAHLTNQWLLMLAFAYLSVRTRERDEPLHRALAWIGGLALLPLTFLVVERVGFWNRQQTIPSQLQAAGWLLGLGLPLGLAFWLRGRAAWMNAVAAVWVVVLGTFPSRWDRNVTGLLSFTWYELGPYFWCGLGSIGLVLWGLKEGRRERINLGVAGFAITVLTFYFATVMDKLGRATSLIGLGLVFLVVGWGLERTRRRLMARLEAGAQ